MSSSSSKTAWRQQRSSRKRELTRSLQIDQHLREESWSSSTNPTRFSFLLAWCSGQGDGPEFFYEALHRDPTVSFLEALACWLDRKHGSGIGYNKIEKKETKGKNKLQKYGEVIKDALDAFFPPVIRDLVLSYKTPLLVEHRGSIREIFSATTKIIIPLLSPQWNSESARPEMFRPLFPTTPSYPFAKVFSRVLDASAAVGAFIVLQVSVPILCQRGCAKPAFREMIGMIRSCKGGRRKGPICGAIILLTETDRRFNRPLIFSDTPLPFYDTISTEAQVLEAIEYSTDFDRDRLICYSPATNEIANFVSNLERFFSTESIFPQQDFFLNHDTF